MNTDEHRSLVDVVVPIRNGERWLTGLLATIRNQTYKPNNLILVDDNSDEPLEIKKIDEGLIPSITIHSAIGRGLSNARNEGINLCSTKYIAFLDVDDRWSPEKLEKHITFLESNEIFDAVFSNASTVDLQGEVLRNHFSSVAEVTTKGLVLEKTPVLGSASSIVIRREKVLEIGYFDVNLSYAEDLDYWIRLSMRARIGCLPEILTFITENPQSMQRGITPFEKYLKEISAKLSIFKKHPKFFPESLDNLGRTLLYISQNKGIKLNEKIELFRMTIKSEMLNTFYKKRKFIILLTQNFFKLALKILSRKLYLTVAIPIHFAKKVFAKAMFDLKVKK